MAGFTYSAWVSHMITIMQFGDDDGEAAFNSMVGYFIERAEYLIYSDPELDFLATRDVDVSQLTTNGLRTVPIAPQMLVLEGISIIIPANTMPNTPGTVTARIPYRRSTRQNIDLTWPYESQTAFPDIINGGEWAIFDMEQGSPSEGEDEPSPLPSSILLKPTPNDTYRVEQTGIIRPSALSAANPTTLLTTYFYPLFLAATVQIACGYQRDYGAASDNPQMALSWKGEYMDQRAVAISLSKRQKSLEGGYSPTPMPMSGMVGQAIAAAPPQPGGPMPQAA